MAVISGIAADVNPTIIECLPDICAGYDNKDIFHADQTGQFLRALPIRSIVAKGDDSKGGRIAKYQITVLLCCSATGDKLQALVIGHSLNLRCFRGTISSVPVIYHVYTTNCKAWITSDPYVYDLAP